MQERLSSPAGVDPRAVVDPAARLAASVRVGPWAVIGPDVEIGDDTIIEDHVVITGPTRIGARNRIAAFASVGGAPQHRAHRGEPTRVVIGDDNSLGAYCTVHRGTEQDRRETCLGNRNVVGQYVHVAHDCVVGNDTHLGGYTALGGHVQIEDGAFLEEMVLIHQFVTIGRYAYCHLRSAINKDIPPFLAVGGHPAHKKQVEMERMRRAGLSDADQQAVLRAYELIYDGGRRLEDCIPLLPSSGEPACIRDFVSNARRSIVR